MATATSSDPKRDALKLGLSTIDELLTFKTVVDIQRYMADRHSRDFREFEAETAVRQAFDGAGDPCARPHPADSRPRAKPF